MNKKLYVLPALCALSVTGPGKANLVLEPTFEQKMAESELVFIGTVTANDRGGRYGSGSTATLSVLRTLKGEGGGTITVSTYHPIDELNPRCCEVGATYMMFLRPSVPDGQLMSIWGDFGMIRVGGPQNHVNVIPAR